MGAHQSLEAGYACVSGDLSAIDDQYLVTRTFLRKQVSLQNDDYEKRTPSHSSQQIKSKLVLHAGANELEEPSLEMTDPGPFFIASFSGTDKDKELVAVAMRTAMIQTLDGSRSKGAAMEASAGLWAEKKLPPSSTLLAAAGLEKAVRLSDGVLVRQLVHAEGAVVDQYSQEGMTVLHVAATQGLAHMISILVLLDASVDAKTLETGDTALHITASAGSLNDAARFECLDMLISLGASLDLPNKDGRVPLHVAAMSGYLKAVQRLLAAGARRDVRGKDGRSPTDLAEACGAHEVYEYLSALNTRVQMSKIKQYQQWL